MTGQSLANYTSDAVCAQSLTIVVLGPGPSSPGFEKRTQLVEHLRTARPDDEIATPEEAIAGNAVLKKLVDEIGLPEVEAMLVKPADAIFALVVQDPATNGVLAELAQFLPDEGLRPKIFVALPAKTRRLIKNQPPFILSQFNKLHSMQQFAYTPEQLQSCTAIRARIDSWLLGARAKKLLSAYRFVPPSR